MNHFLKQKPVWVLAVLILFLAACTAAAESEATAVVPEVEATDTAVAPSSTPAAAATDTAVAAVDTPEPEPTASPEPTATLEPTPSSEPTPEPTAEPLADPEPLFEIGATANWTETNDPIGIEGEIEYVSVTEIVIRDFVFLAEEAPGVDIRLGVGDDFSDEVAVSLRDITGRTYEGRTVTLTIPPAGFDGRSFDSIGVYCYDTGDLFDWALWEAP